MGQTYTMHRDLAEQRIKSHEDKQRKRRAEGQSTQRLSDEFYTSELKAWRCTARSSHSCHVHIHTDRVDGKIVVVKRIGKHTHLPKSTSAAVRQVMLSLKLDYSLPCSSLQFSKIWMGIIVPLSNSPDLECVVAILIALILFCIPWMWMVGRMYHASNLSK